MSIYTQYKRWLGFGVKSGGQLLVGGVESTTAHMWNLGNGESFDLQIIASRWGLGLGGSGSVACVLGFGFIEPYELHRKTINDWGVNVALTEKLISKSALQSLVFAKRFYDIYKQNRALLAYRHVKSAIKDITYLQQVRDLTHVVLAGLEANQRSGVVVLELPFAGAGLELSAYVTRGKMYVSNSSDMDLGG